MQKLEALQVLINCSNTYTARGSFFNGVGLVSLPTVLKYRDLKPEIAKETEFGIEAEFQRKGWV